MNGNPLTGEPQITVSQNSKALHLPGLNGLRAIAALAVVLSHITLDLGNFGLNNKIFGTDDYGNPTGLNLAGYGVTIFFTLSGFLITFLLLKEKEVTGKVNIKNFYIRRILRIWPLYYLYLLLCVITYIVYDTPYIQSLPFYVFMAANIPFFLYKAVPLLTHYWSLGVEEQFYLFFPHLAKKSNKNLLRMAIALTLALLTLKIIFWVLRRYHGLETPYLAINTTRFHNMLIGVVGAILYYNQNQRFLQLSTHVMTQIVAWIAMLLIALNKFHFASVIDVELVSIIALCLIMGQVTKRNRIINLENAAFDFIGKISYGIYVIHPLLIFYFSRLLGTLADNSLNYLLLYLLITTTTILLAWLSYEFYEKRFLQLKTKYTAIKSENAITRS